MKENKYDDPGFFVSYGNMPRSVEGLNAAGEWQVLQKMLPDFEGKSVLDLGCGFGWHCIYAKQQGAKRVVGIDLSEKMLETAENKSVGLDIEYRQMAIEDIDFSKEEFDVVISSLAFHYVKDFSLICRKINHCLKPGGHFIFSQEHPVFTSRPEQDWYVDEAGNRLHWPLDHYQEEGIRRTSFLGHTVTKYHRTVETVFNALIDSQFRLRRISEPKPAEETLIAYPEMKDEKRRPIFLMVAAIKEH
ncbi:Methyltransferase domain-containing protein [Pedobacter steynii]|uniref:Methyltransferase domain-containing protein n=1 Tax=Pedobacter steynii TaxID=430522 RepID=A0A1H0KHH2_9SPHI|nr:class I SAM-dependent methyltransferase [Pedobacter steynii]NQX43289.1 class I SAM-dependent methyltransferase [Pedobacter steynii]SDO55211.1 Methyltransferase domain-containing protein [Pedobacter steynii]